MDRRNEGAKRAKGERNFMFIVSHSHRRSGSTVQASLPSHEKRAAKMAAARKLAVRLFWMLRTNSLSGGRSHREELARWRGRRKLDTSGRPPFIDASGRGKLQRRGTPDR